VLSIEVLHTVNALAGGLGKILRLRLKLPRLQPKMTSKVAGLVVQGRKLSAKDANGLSDPYLGTLRFSKACFIFYHTCNDIIHE